MIIQLINRLNVQLSPNSHNLLMMKAIRICTLFLVVTIFPLVNVHAWDLEIGVRALIPRIGTGVQEYEDKDGNKDTFKPTVESTATGQSYHLGLRWDAWQLDYDNSEFTFDSSLAAGAVVPVDTDLEVTITENRLGINYHIERELAGLFAGLGYTSIKEEIKSDDNTWVLEASRPYLKGGIDLIINSITLRYEMIAYSLGEHNIQVNSLAFLLVF